MAHSRANDTMSKDPNHPDAPGVPSRADDNDMGLVRGGDKDVSDRPQGDPEVPELGAHDRERGGQRTPD